MPFRHLLYNRRNGAPQRPPVPQHMTSQPEQFFQQPAELAQYQWSEMDFAPYHTQPADAVIMNNEQAYPSKRQALSVETAHSHHGHFFSPTNYASSPNQPFVVTSDGFYRTGPFNYSELIDADISSVSQGSMYSPMTSNSRIDGMMDDDTFSRNSSSRKPSATSDMDVSGDGERLCPLLSGQTGKCDPSRCGPNAPCLNFASLAPIEECGPTTNVTQAPESHAIVARLESSLSPALKNSKRTNQRPRQRRQRSGIINESDESTTAYDQNKNRTRVISRNSSKTKSGTSTDNEPLTTEQTNKIRARQAHSLVERKYRENLNAKIQQLHQTLQQTEFGPKSGYTRLSPPTGEEEEDDDEEEEVQEKSTNSSKVKKSDVLTEALSYVNATEVEMRHMTDEIRRLNARVETLEKLVKCEDCKLMKQMNTLKLKHAK